MRKINLDIWVTGDAGEAWVVDALNDTMLEGVHHGHISDTLPDGHEGDLGWHWHDCRPLT